MIVLGIDPGLTRCGVGVIELRAGRKVSFVDAGVVRTPHDLDLAERINTIYQGLDSWIRRHSPDSIAVERVFAQNNLNTVIPTAQASAIGLLLAAQHHIPSQTHTPSEIKAAISGSGRADKRQVGTMVTRILQLQSAPKPADAADAVAVAICHAWTSPTINRGSRPGTVSNSRDPRLQPTSKETKRRVAELMQRAQAISSQRRPSSSRTSYPSSVDSRKPDSYDTVGGGVRRSRGERPGRSLARRVERPSQRPGARGDSTQPPSNSSLPQSSKTSDNAAVPERTADPQKDPMTDPTLSSKPITNPHSREEI